MLKGLKKITIILIGSTDGYTWNTRVMAVLTTGTLLNYWALIKTTEIIWGLVLSAHN